MASKMRVSIYLPTEYNPDPKRKRKKRRKIPREHHNRVMLELEQHFKERFQGTSTDFMIRKRTSGTWKGQIDKIEVISTDLNLTSEDLAWLRERKNEWKKKDRFDQEEMYVIYFPIMVV